MFEPITTYIIAILIGYLLGCSNMALYLSHFRRKNLRKSGSGNLGTGNTYLCFGLSSAILVFLHDSGKAMLAMELVSLLFPDMPYLCYTAGAAAVLGHIYPFYLHFRGGKGVAAFLGMMFFPQPRRALIILLAAGIFTLLVDYFALTAGAIALIFPIETLLTTGSPAAVLPVFLAALLVLFVHRDNYRRIIAGTEPGCRSRIRRH